MAKSRLVNAKDMLVKAMKNKYAVGHFNINNLEWTKAILEVAQETKTPVILGTSEGAVKYMGGFGVIVGMVNGLMEDLNITVPVALHLDHGTTPEMAIKALQAGYSSVMYDGSHEEISVNLANTKKVVDEAKKTGASVEGEVGVVGGQEDGVKGQVRFASLDECKKIAATGITMLAASLGSVHGHYKSEPVLGFKEMTEYSKVTGLPLVLHGGSGIPIDMIKKAIQAGEAKINVNTEIQESFAAATAKYIESGQHKVGTGFDPRKLLAPGVTAMKATIKEKMTLFGCIGKA